MSVNEMNIFQKMSLITAELQTVAKNLTVATAKNASYKAVSERDVLDAVKPLEGRYGVYSYPCKRKVLESNLLESENTYTDSKGNVSVTKKTTFMTRIETVYRFVNVQKPDEWIETTVFSEGIDSQDKGSGKAMTYGDKYALLKAYKVSTGDDPDQTASEDTNYKKASYPKAPAVVAERTPRERLIFKLKEMGVDFTAYAKEKGLTKETTDERFAELLKELEG